MVLPVCGWVSPSPCLGGWVGCWIVWAWVFVKGKMVCTSFIKSGEMVLSVYVFGNYLPPACKGFFSSISVRFLVCGGRL